MKVAVTGGTGFVGAHLAAALAEDGHDVVLISRAAAESSEVARRIPSASLVGASVTDEESLVAAFEGCSVVIHCAGINREIGSQTYEAVHVRGTNNVVSAAKRTGVDRIALLSYLRARPDCGSGYLESKWAAEEIVRSSGIDHLIVKAGMIFGRGDHMLDHTAKAIGTFGIFTTIGVGDRIIQPVAIADVVRILRSFAVDQALLNSTIGLVGPEQLTLRQAAKRIAHAMGRRVLVLPAPIWALYFIGFIAERVMNVPLISIAQVRLLREGPVPGPLARSLPAEFTPEGRLDEETIREGLPSRLRYGVRDLRRPR